MTVNRMTVDKRALLEQLHVTLTEDLRALERRQRDTAEGATHEESRSEHAKDTRATEQSYLARGLADRVEQMQRTTEALSSLVLRAFETDDPIAVSALIHLTMAPLETPEPTGSADARREETWWLVPSAGGYTLLAGDLSIRTITPASPLGRAMLGLTTGDEGTLRTPRGARTFEIHCVE